MPFLNLITNLPDHKLSEKLHLALSAQASKLIGKPEEVFSVTIEAGRRMCRAGTLEPCCELWIASVGTDTPEKTQPIARGLTDFLAEQTGIPSGRILIIFSAPAPHMISLAGDLVTS